MDKRWWPGGPMGRLEERVLIRVGAANTVGAAVALLIGAVTDPGDNPVGNHLVGSMSAADVTVFIAYMAVALPLGAFISCRIFRAACGWADREPERPRPRGADPLSVPWRLAAVSL